MKRPQTHMISSSRRSTTKAATLLLALLLTAASSARAHGPAVPAALEVPAGNILEFQYHGVGVQIYTWSGTLATWGASTPHAVLFNDDGGVAAIHYAGPTWQNDDGSKVLGAKLAAVSVNADAIPWLLLQAASNSGPGLFADVTYVQRLETIGGLAPAAPGTFDGEQTLVPYSAEYLFYHYEYVFTEVPLPGLPFSFAYGINDQGLITGFYDVPSEAANPTNNTYAYVDENGALTTGITGPGPAVETLLGPANNQGLAIGNYGDFTTQQAAFYHIASGKWTALPNITGMPLNFGNGINDAGHAVGTAYSGGTSSVSIGPGLTWFWDGKDYSFFTIPEADANNGGAYASGLNNGNQVCGYYVDTQTNYHGFLKDGSDVIPIDVPGAAGTFGLGLNNRGDVAGFYLEPNRHGFVWSHGTIVTVDVPFPGALSQTLTSINDHGDVAGQYRDADGILHAFTAHCLDDAR